MESWGKGPWLVGLVIGALFFVLGDVLSGGYEDRPWWMTAMAYVVVLVLAFAGGAKVDGWRSVGKGKLLRNRAIPEDEHMKDSNPSPFSPAGESAAKPSISTGIHIEDSDNVTVDGSHIRGMGRGIVSKNSRNVRLNDNDIA